MNKTQDSFFLKDQELVDLFKYQLKMEIVWPSIIMDNESQLGELFKVIRENLNYKWIFLNGETNDQDRRVNFFSFTCERGREENKVLLILSSISNKISLYNILSGPPYDKLTSLEEYNFIAITFYKDVMKPAANSLFINSYLFDKDGIEWKERLIAQINK